MSVVNTLAPYIQHLPECNKLGAPCGYEWNPLAVTDRPCTCGLDIALSLIGVKDR